MSFDIMEEVNRIAQAHAASYGVQLNSSFGKHAEVKEHKGVSMTEYRIVGSLPSVLVALMEMFAKWPGRGYGTQVHELYQQQDGQYAMRLSHANSSGN